MKNENAICRISLLLILFLGWKNASNAQTLPLDFTKNYVVSPVIEFMSKTTTRSYKTNKPLDEKRGSLNSNLLFFYQNIQMCKDLFSGKGNNTTPNTNESPVQIKKDSTKNERKEQKALSNKKTKSFWNQPGNTKSRI